jgi:hypothetical protein
MLVSELVSIEFMYMIEVANSLPMYGIKNIYVECKYVKKTVFSMGFMGFMGTFYGFYAYLLR